MGEQAEMALAAGMDEPTPEEELREELTTLRADNIRLQEEIKTVRLVNDTLRARVKELERELSAKAEEVEELRSVIDPDELERRVADFADALDRADAAEQQLADARRLLKLVSLTMRADSDDGVHSTLTVKIETLKEIRAAIDAAEREE